MCARLPLLHHMLIRGQLETINPISEEADRAARARGVFIAIDQRRSSQLVEDSVFAAEFLIKMFSISCCCCGLN